MTLSRSAINSANRLNGLKSQRKAAKTMGIRPRYRQQLNSEESWGSPEHLPGTKWECKSGKMPALLKHAFEQVEAQRSFGSLWKPGVLLKTDTGTFAVMRGEDLLQLCKALAETGNAWKVQEHLRNALREIEAAKAAAK